MAAPSPDHHTDTHTSAERHALRWHAQREAGAMWGMRFTFGVLNVVGRKGVAPVVYLVVFYFFVFGKKNRQASLDYLAHVQRFSPDSGIRANGSTSFRHFMSFASAILDKLQAWQGKIRWEQVDIHNDAPFHALAQQNIGGMLIGSHLGNMEVCRALGSLSHRLKLTVLVHTKHARNFNRLLEQAGASSFELIQVTEVGIDTAILLREKIQQGEWIVIMGDRVPVNSSRFSITSFLGENAALPQGPFLLASLLECPVMLMFCLKQNGRYQITMEPFTDKIELRRKFRDQDLKTYIDRYAARLQHYCLSAPLQWYNFYPFWKQHI